MPIRVYYEVLNQKGTPALYSDNYAQRPAAGYVGRIFYSPDTAQIFYDTGSTWTLLADAGVGSGSLASVCANGNTTATGISITAGGLSTNSLTSTNLTAGSIPFIGTGGLFSQDNTNLFWDNTNKYFGINTNTPSTYLDVHGTNNVAVQINNTTTADSKIAFLQAGVGKWRIGNLYSGGTNLFHIYNNTAISLAMQIDSSNAALFYGSLSANSFISAGAGVLLTNGSVTTTAGKTGVGGLTAGLSIALASGFNQTLTFPTGVAYTYTFPSATGTLALTSNLSSYLPLTGGTLSGALTINSTLFIDPQNTGLTGLDVASNNVIFRSDNLEGFKRKLQINMGSGTLVSVTANGYETNRITDLAFYTSTASGVNGFPSIYITATGNVGLSTGSPDQKLTIQAQGTSNGLISFKSSAGTTTTFIGVPNSAGDVISTSITTDICFRNETGNILFSTNGNSERFRITTAGILQAGGTARRNALQSSYFGYNGAYRTLIIGSNSADYTTDGVTLCFNVDISGNPSGSFGGTGTEYVFRNVGSFITPNSSNNGYNTLLSWNSSGVVTVTTSDYRTKEDLKSFEALPIVNSMKLYDFRWIELKDRMHGVIAHELQELVPYAVLGEKDGDRMQGVDYSKLVPILAKAIQELNNKIDNLN